MLLMRGGDVSCLMIAGCSSQLGIGATSSSSPHINSSPPPLPALKPNLDLTLLRAPKPADPGRRRRPQLPHHLAGVRPVPAPRHVCEPRRRGAGAAGERAGGGLGFGVGVGGGWRRLDATREHQRQSLHHSEREAMQHQQRINAHTLPHRTGRTRRSQGRWRTGSSGGAARWTSRLVEGLGWARAFDCVRACSLRAAPACPKCMPCFFESPNRTSPIQPIKTNPPTFNRPGHRCHHPRGGHLPAGQGVGAQAHPAVHFRAGRGGRRGVRRRWVGLRGRCLSVRVCVLCMCVF